MLELEHVPILRTQREIYDLPRGWERFTRYIEATTGGTDDLVLPLGLVNPMGKAHVADHLDALLGLDAESVAAAAVREASLMLPGVSARLQTFLVVVDDAQGGWTDRHLTEAQHRFGGQETHSDKARRTWIAQEAERDWVVALLWTSETPSSERVREQVLAAVYRVLYTKRCGVARTLRQMMRQEGPTLAFAGERALGLDEEELASAREVILPHLETTRFPLAFACLYGDDAALAAGFPRSGFRPGPASQWRSTMPCGRAGPRSERSWSPSRQPKGDSIGLSSAFGPSNAGVKRPPEPPVPR